MAVVVVLVFATAAAVAAGVAVRLLLPLQMSRAQCMGHFREEDDYSTVVVALPHLRHGGSTNGGCCGEMYRVDVASFRWWRRRTCCHKHGVR